MANPNLNNAAEIQSKGGKRIAYMEVTATGQALTVPDTWHDMPFRSKSDMEFKEPLKAVNDESGDVAAYESDNFESTLQLTSLQDSAAVETFILETVSGKYFAIFMDCGVDSPGKRKERFIPCARIERSYKSSAPGRTPEIKILIQQVTSQAVPTALPTWAVGDAEVFTVAAGGYYKVIASAEV